MARNNNPTTKKSPRNKNKGNPDCKILKAICEQRQRLEKSLSNLVDACNAAIAARSFSKDKETYQTEIMAKAVEASSLLKEDHPDRPCFDYTSIPASVSLKNKYRCSTEWFCNRLALLLLDFKVGDKFSKAQARRIKKALGTIKYIGLDTIGYGHSVYDEEDLLEDCIKCQSESKKPYDFTRKMPLKYIVNELCRFMKDYSPEYDYAWYEAKVYREVQESLVCVCLATLGLNPNHTFEVYQALAKMPKGKKNFSRQNAKL